MASIDLISEYSRVFIGFVHISRCSEVLDKLRDSLEIINI